MTTNIETIAPINHGDLRERLRRLMADEALSQNTIARGSGISSSALSQFLQGEYSGDNNKVAAALVRWINHRTASDKINAIMPVAPGWVDAPTARRIYDALSYAQVAGDIAVIYGGAGLSKTTTIRRYRDQNPNVWVATATPATASVGVLLEEIALALGLRDFPLHPARLQRAVISKMMDTGGLLIVDEAQHLTKQALEAARSIHDSTTVGLALSGNASVFNRLYGGGDNGFAQLYSRVGKRVRLVRPLAGDVLAISKSFGVAGAAETKLLEEIARKPGALRMVVKTLRLASVITRGSPIARGHIEQAWNDLQGDVLSDEASAEGERR